MKKRGTAYIFIEDGESLGPLFLDDPYHNKNYLIEIEDVDYEKFNLYFESKPLHDINRLAKLCLMRYEYSSMEENEILVKSEKIILDYLKNEETIEIQLKPFIEKLLYLIQEAIKLNYTVCFDLEHLD